MIRIEGLTKHFGENIVVDSLNLSLNPGELLVLLGPSGCGKTTLLKMMNRLVEPTAGRVWLEHRDTRQMSGVQLRRSIGYVFQGIGLFPHMTIARNTGIVGELLGWPPDRIARRVDELLIMVELDPDQFRHRMPGELSGGQRQRVGVARALCAEPKLILMDEPFGALDPMTREALQDQLIQLHQKLEATIVFVTHDMTEAILIADRIAVMHSGRIVQIGPPSELLANPSDETVSQLIKTPKRHAERLASLMETESRSEK